MSICAIVTPTALAASQREELKEILQAVDLLDYIDIEETLDFGRIADEALNRSTQEDNSVIIGTGAPVFDSRLAAATGASHVLAVASKEDSLTVQIYKAGLARFERAITSVFIINEHGIPEEEKSTELYSIPVVDAQSIRNNTPRTPLIVPEIFQRNLLKQASATGSHIILPEGEDDRILYAAHELLAQKVCQLTILGDPEAIRVRAGELNLDLTAAAIQNPEDGDLLDSFAEEFAEIRKSKGITLDEARETMKDISYYATMMIKRGLADGMVSGAAHTTAHTIKPSFQIIKTAPGNSVVSSIFLMVMDGAFWAFGDCAVNPNPNAEQLAEIARTSAETAEAFGIDARVALLSYSTGNSGSGPDVEKVQEAVGILHRDYPDLRVDGPLQFDAAVVPSVGKKKMPGSSVAGHANVFIFPDLNSGNIAYKAVQRSAEALAVGPILQGLNRPVNDLSRGATVPDIINTVAVTAIQAAQNPRD